MMNSTDQDSFDRLPDDVVLAIFDSLQDARSLCLSMGVCRRFRAIAPQVFDVYLPIPRRKTEQAKEQGHEIRRRSLRSLLAGTLARSFQFFSRMIRPRPKDDEEEIGDLEFYSRCLPDQILTRFRQIRTLHLRLPCNGYHKPEPKPFKAGRSAALLKWKADFGREIHGCVILGARLWSPKTDGSPEPSNLETRFLGDEELKLRIVWTISSLIAASARHYLVQETVRGLERVERVEVTDESGQGRLCMDREEVAELKVVEGKPGAEISEHRTPLPALRMRMWFMERVEAAGMVMEGGTLVVIRPAGSGGGSRSDAEMVAGAFGEDEAVRKLMAAKKCYSGDEFVLSCYVTNLLITNCYKHVSTGRYDQLYKLN